MKTEIKKDLPALEKDTINDRLRRGEIVVVGNALYGRCSRCGNIVQFNKRIFGSLHFCKQTGRD